MSDPDDPPAEPSLEQRIALLEAQTASGPARSVVDKLSRYLPFIALSHVFVTAPAFLISIGVAYFTFVQADATQKMQVASVWPHVEFDTGNLGDAGQRLISFSAVNQGVGPARIEGVELSYRGHAFADAHSLLRTCCATAGKPIVLEASSLNGQVMRPGEEIDFFRVKPTGLPEAGYEKLDQERAKVRTRICYCSVFDDCWIEDSQVLKQQQVKQCPADWVQYGIPSPTPARR